VVPGFDAALAQRLQSAPVSLLFENWVQSQSPSFSVSTAFNHTMASKSLDYLLYQFKLPANIGTDNIHRSQSPGANSTMTLEINGRAVTPAMTPYDAWWSLCDALDATQNPIVDPGITQYAGTTGFTTTQFCYLHRLCFPTTGEEGRTLISGMDTNGSMPLSLKVAGADATTIYGTVLGITTQEVQIHPGRQLIVIP
jgi:hypothetical protein